MSSAVCFNLDQSKLLLSGNGYKILCAHLTYSLIHHFEYVPNSKKLQTTPEMWLSTLSSVYTHFNTLKKKALGNIVEKGEIAQIEEFHLFPQCFLCDLYLKIL